MRVGLGIDVGGTKLLACAIDEAGKVLSEATAPSPEVRADLADALASVATSCLAGIAPGDEVLGVGLGLPGLVDRDGVLHQAANLHAAEETDVGADLSSSLLAVIERFPAPRHAPPRAVHAENDVTCAALGEHAFGAARGASEAVVVAFGTGIGAGLISGGHLLVGAQGFAGEVGHMVVVQGGARCGCGGRGCWEQYASGSAIERLAREAAAREPDSSLAARLAGQGPLRAESIVAAADDGDRLAGEVLAEVAGWIALGLANLAEILDPALIIVGGGLAAEDDALIAPAIERFSTTRRGAGPRAVRVLRAELGPRAGAIGAAALALGRS